MNSSVIVLTHCLMAHALVSDATWYAFICVPLFALISLPLYRYIREAITSKKLPGSLTMVWILCAVITLCVIVPFIVDGIVRCLAVGI